MQQEIYPNRVPALRSLAYLTVSFKCVIHMLLQANLPTNADLPHTAPAMRARVCVCVCVCVTDIERAEVIEAPVGCGREADPGQQQAPGESVSVTHPGKDMVERAGY